MENSDPRIVAGDGVSSFGRRIYQNQNGFDLPGVTLPQGQDEVRAADGTTCSSAVSGSGAYMDVGLIGNRGGSGDFASYGRVVVPLGKKSKRLDCSKLYELEVERLRLELELIKMGAGSMTSGETVSSTTAEPTAAEAPVEPVKKPAKSAVKRGKMEKKAWVSDGWTDSGR